MSVGASTAFIQVLSAPTREEVDKAHVEGKSLHIGVFGLINLSYIPKRRRSVIVLLLVSSIPLHLMVRNRLIGPSCKFSPPRPWTNYSYTVQQYHLWLHWDV